MSLLMPYIMPSDYMVPFTGETLRPALPAPTHTCSLVMMDTAPDTFLMVKKARPFWQAGMLNLLGGKVEKGETAEQCAIREVCEESGLPREAFSTPVYCGMVLGSDGYVIAFYGQQISYQWMWHNRAVPNNPDHSEPVSFIRLQDFNARGAGVECKVVPSLRLIVPLMLTGRTGWVIEHDTERLKGVEL